MEEEATSTGVAANGLLMPHPFNKRNLWRILKTRIFLGDGSFNAAHQRVRVVRSKPALELFHTAAFTRKERIPGGRSTAPHAQNNFPI